MRQFARSIVETVRHPLLILDERLLVVATNPPFAAVFGTRVEEILGRPAYELFDRQWDLPALRERLERVVQTAEPFDGFEVSHAASPLGHRHLTMNARLVHRDEDETPMILLAVEDETDRRRDREALQRLNAALRDLNEGLEQRVAARTAQLAQTNAELSRANRELEASNRELEAFCYSVSHDLRAPLRAIDGFSQELLAGYADRIDDQGRHYLNRVRSATQRMGQLIDDLLKLSRVGRAELHPEPVDLSGVATAVAAELAQRTPGRDVRFATRPGLVAVSDPRLTRLVLENLLGNAWKFTSKKPTAVVEFGRTDPGPTGRAGFFVRDDGAGFDMRFADKLFGAFQRLHPDRESPGTGIGLATVQRIVRRHGGDVWAEGEPGRGATFYFTLPVPGGGVGPARGGDRPHRGHHDVGEGNPPRRG